MSKVVTADGEEPISPEMKAALDEVRRLTNANQAFTNLLVALVRRAGSKTEVSNDDLQAIAGCALVSKKNEDGTGVTLSVIRAEPPAKKAELYLPPGVGE